MASDGLTATILPASEAPITGQFEFEGGKAQLILSNVDAGTYTLTLQDLASETAQSHDEPQPIAAVTTKKFKIS